MTLPVGQALNALFIFQRVQMAKFPAREAFALGRMIGILGGNADVIGVEAARNAAITKCGNGRGEVEADKLAEFAAEFQPVAVTPIDVDVKPLPLSILDHAPEMTPAEMLILQPFFEGDSE